MPAAAVISNADPRRTLLGLVDPVELDPGFVQRMRNYRMPGTVAKVNLTLGALPAFPGVRGSWRSARPHPHRAEPRLPREGVRRVEVRRDLRRAVPRRHHSVAARSRRCVRRTGTSCRSTCSSRPTSSRGYRLDRRRAISWRPPCVRTLERYAPGIWNAVEHRQVLTPVDLEETYGLTRGHIHHGEQSLDQLFTHAADRSAGRSIGRRSTACSCAAPARIPAARSPACLEGTRRARSRRPATG